MTNGREQILYSCMTHPFGTVSNGPLRILPPLAFCTFNLSSISMRTRRHGRWEPMHNGRQVLVRRHRSRPEGVQTILRLRKNWLCLPALIWNSSWMTRLISIWAMANTTSTRDTILSTETPMIGTTISKLSSHTSSQLVSSTSLPRTSAAHWKHSIKGTKISQRIITGLIRRKSILYL